MIVLVGGEKGGSGKSCLAQNIAVYFSREKQANVMLVDCDPQRTTSDWVQERHTDASLAWINCVQMYGKIRYELQSLEKHYDVVVVDCGGQDSVALRSAMVVASHVLFPLRPKRRDLKTLEHLEDLVSACNIVNPAMIVGCVMTQCPSLPNQANRILDAKEVCESFNIRVLKNITYSRNIYDDSEEKGLSVMDVDSDGKAANEIRAIIEELLAMKAIQEDGAERPEEKVFAVK
ncbi:MULTISPECIES: AAA family ATPase [unclassified Arsukibacterium]|uniref:AAA family ATPase n=1 Tax=unclassified Arsukibacterium TaxID=2635278 RepID=UPI000C575051|nr:MULTISPECIES: AAA family ATPase [unclassified Arsukibacterium]MAA94649.1 chromosome partitioning protein ParA [Rheinheimera sp.]MBM32767.1 chromosome partitioning protein ParA [Rheinheimera sp.]HAW93411.1 chromosome partitioning protein ParA [Candidatus Azambacteria bacterium]|tara:strand:+ start:17775 stop:18473 length:699 start_codon:yes stop_codon:yes gene_type:complete